jgi:hypothetical protein
LKPGVSLNRRGRPGCAWKDYRGSGTCTGRSGGLLQTAYSQARKAQRVPLTAVGSAPGARAPNGRAFETIRNALQHPPLSLRNLVLACDHHQNPHGAHSAYAEGAPKTLPTHIPRMFTPPHQPILLETNGKSPPNGPEGVARRRASWRLGEENGVVRHLNKTPACYKGWNINNAPYKPACKQN